jgi:hypothetical protein
MKTVWGGGENNCNYKRKLSAYEAHELKHVTIIHVIGGIHF